MTNEEKELQDAKSELQSLDVGYEYINSEAYKKAKAVKFVLNVTASKGIPPEYTIDDLEQQGYHEVGYLNISKADISVPKFKDMKAMLDDPDNLYNTIANRNYGEVIDTYCKQKTAEVQTKHDELVNKINTLQGKIDAAAAAEASKSIEDKIADVKNGADWHKLIKENYEALKGVDFGKLNDLIQRIIKTIYDANDSTPVSDNQEFRLGQGYEHVTGKRYGTTGEELYFKTLGMVNKFDYTYDNSIANTVLKTGKASGKQRKYTDKYVKKIWQLILQVGNEPTDVEVTPAADEARDNKIKGIIKNNLSTLEKNSDLGSFIDVTKLSLI